MLEKVFRLGAVLGLMSTTAFAETTTSPYADWTDRQIKALSSEQISIYTDGKGGGYALEAELTSFMDCIRHSTRPVVGGLEALAAMEVAEDVLSSVAAHQWDGIPNENVGPFARPIDQQRRAG